MTDDKDFSDQLSVRELRQWLNNLSETHQNHFQKGQLPGGRIQQHPDSSEGARLSSFLPNKEPEGIAIAETTHGDKLNKRIVSYSSEVTDCFFKPVGREDFPIAPMAKIAPCNDGTMSSWSHSSDGSTHEETRGHEEDTFEPDDFSWSSGACIRDECREGNVGSKSCNGVRNSGKGLTMHACLGTAQKNRAESSFAQARGVFSTTKAIVADNIVSEQQSHVDDNKVAKRIERIGRKSEMVYQLQLALQEKWDQDRPVVHKKKVQWRAMKGTYKKRVSLSVKESV